jgi:hypothetical protein
VRPKIKIPWTDIHVDIRKGHPVYRVKIPFMDAYVEVRWPRPSWQFWVGIGMIAAGLLIWWLW